MSQFTRFRNLSLYFISNKMKNKKYHTVETAPKYNRQVVDLGKFDTSNFPDLVQVLQN